MELEINSKKSIVNNSVKGIAKENPNQYMTRASTNRPVPNGMQLWCERTKYQLMIFLLLDYMKINFK